MRYFDQKGRVRSKFVLKDANGITVLLTVVLVPQSAPRVVLLCTSIYLYLSSSKYIDTIRDLERSSTITNHTAVGGML